MFAQPKLTICVPSRNRQRYFQETVRSLLMNLRTDIEFIFADNSDDPSLMNGFMEDVIADPRVKYLPSGERVFSMVDNWERCLEVATGEFVSVIGDDDYVDPDVADLIGRTQSETPVDVFVWSRLTYNWPNNRPRHCNVSVPLGIGVHTMKREWLYEEFFGWTRHAATPNCPFSIYHGAVSRALMEKIRQKFGGRYFEHPTVDFENSCKILTTAENIIYVERPFSVLGSCPDSNSARIRTPEDMKKVHAEFMKDLGRNMDEDPYMKDFPFPLVLGLAAAIAQCQQWFKVTYGHRIDGWEKNFAAACGINCGMAADEHSYEMMVAGYREGLKKWHGGKYLEYFNPSYVPKTEAKFFTGVSDKSLLIDEDIAGVQTPAELYHFACQLISSADQLDFSFLRPARLRA